MQAESSGLEYKGAFYWNRRREALDKQLRFGTVRTIGAFANTAGGELRIGYSDGGEVIGINEEMNALYKDRHLDQYEQRIHEHLKTTLFPYPYRAYDIQILPHGESGLYVCHILVRPQPGVTYVKSVSDDGVHENQIYIRTGNRTIKVLDLERDRFVVERFGGSWSL